MSSWKNNEIQFARLICELIANDCELDATREAMDLDSADFDALLERALEVWNNAKQDSSYVPDVVVTGDSQWIDVGNVSIYVRKRDEGVSVTTHPLNCESDVTLTETWVTYDEAQDAYDLYWIPVESLKKETSNE
jgi:hypothetical protein